MLAHIYKCDPTFRCVTSDMWPTFINVLQRYKCDSNPTPSPNPNPTPTPNPNRKCGVTYMYLNVVSHL